MHYRMPVPRALRFLLNATTTPRLLARPVRRLPGCKSISPLSLRFVVLHGLSGVVVPSDTGWARRRRRLELRWVFRGQDGGAPGTERRNAPPASGGPGPDPGGGVRSTGWGSRSQAPYGTVGAVSGGEQVRLAGGPRLAAKWRAGGDTDATGKGRSVRESMLGGCARQVDRAGLGRLLGDMLAEAGPYGHYLNAGRGRAGCRKPGAYVGVIRHSDLSNSVRPSSKDAEWGCF